MNKILYFYFWVSTDFDDNIAVKTHGYCLKKYIGVFDECNFIVALDNMLDMKSIKKAIAWIDSVVCGKKYNVRFTKNTELRESVIVLEDFLPKMITNQDEIIFMAHMKGITNVNQHFRNKISVLRWIISMYWYSLEYTDDINNFASSNKYVMYGPLLTNFSSRERYGNLGHNKMYIGGFYWLKPKDFLKNCLYDEKIPQNRIGRFLGENLTMCLNDETLLSHNNICTVGEKYDLYKDYNKKWLELLSELGDGDNVFNFQNKVLLEVYGEIGK